MLEELGKLANFLGAREKEVGFSQTCTEVRGSPDLDMLPTGAHPAAPLLRHAAEHGVPIAFPRGMYEEERDDAILYGMHASARKEAEFIHMNLAEQIQAGHVAVFTLEAVTSLKNLWFSPIAVIPHVGRRPQLIYDFTWSGLNNTSERLSPMDAMRFRGALQRILKEVLTADPRLGKVYHTKLNLADT